IQNPFGYDANDLPLDAYCDAVLAELSYALKHRSPKALQRAESTYSNSSGDKTSKLSRGLFWSAVDCAERQWTSSSSGTMGVAAVSS
ncbi:hypothetical protein GGI11_006224, partial [Coemansia sp. RSA 2049]